MHWLSENKEWLLSGVLVAVPVAFLGWILSRRSSGRVQRQKGGRGSTNVQVGRDFVVKKDRDDDE